MAITQKSKKLDIATEIFHRFYPDVSLDCFGSQFLINCIFKCTNKNNLFTFLCAFNFIDRRRNLAILLSLIGSRLGHRELLSFEKQYKGGRRDF